MDNQPVKDHKPIQPLTKFYKMTGAGNHFIIIHHNQESEYQLSRLAQILCNREYGIGGDGLLIIYSPKP